MIRLYAMKKYLLLTLGSCISLLALSACTGRAAHPVAAIRSGDDMMTCEQISAEKDLIEIHVQNLVPDTYKREQNGVTFPTIIGAPLGDIGLAEEIEIDAYRERYAELDNLGRTAICNFAWTNTAPDFDVPDDVEEYSSFLRADPYDY